MARPRKKRPAVPVTWIAWSEDFARLFDLVPEGYSPPAQVRACAGRSHSTYTARFTHPSAAPVKAHVRIKRDAEGLFVSESGISIGFRIRGRAEAAQ